MRPATAAHRATVRSDVARPLRLYRMDPVGDLRLADAARLDARQLPSVVLIETDRAFVVLQHRQVDLVHANRARPGTNGFDHALARAASVMRRMDVQAVEQHAKHRVVTSASARLLHV